MRSRTVRLTVRACFEISNIILTGARRLGQQGGVVSPILANLFLHYVFDAWMARTFPAAGVPLNRLRNVPSTPAIGSASTNAS